MPHSPSDYVSRGHCTEYEGGVAEVLARPESEVSPLAEVVARRSVVVRDIPSGDDRPSGRGPATLSRSRWPRVRSLRHPETSTNTFYVEVQEVQRPWNIRR